MMLRPLIALFCLTVPLAAQDAAKPAPPAEAPAPAGWVWQTPSSEATARFAKLSAAAKARLQAEFASNKEALQNLTLKEYNARFEKAFRDAVKEDEDKGLSTGGTPEHLLRERSLTPTRGSAGQASPTSRTGPTSAQRERWEKLSDAAKEKMKSVFRDNRERLSNMTDEQRRTFIESNFKTIEEADTASRNGK